VSGADTIKALEHAGFAQVGQRGSHVKLRRQDGRIAIVPQHRELARGTLRSILKQAGISADEFADLLQSG